MMINYWAMLAAAVASMIIGAVWYGPLFGKLFMREMGFDSLTPGKKAAMKKSMAASYAVQFIASIVMFCVLDWYIVTSLSAGVMGGLLNGFLIWLGFIVPINISDAVWGGKMSLFWLNVGCMFVTLLVAGAILGAF